MTRNQKLGLAAFLLWLFWSKSKTSTNVSMTDAGGNPIMQQCVDPLTGQTVSVPVSQTCPGISSTNPAYSVFYKVLQSL